MIKKNLRLLLSVLICFQLVLAACTTIVPTVTEPSDAIITIETATAPPTQQPTATFSPTATQRVSAIVITDKLLKGLNITVRHPFFDGTDGFNSLIRDFNLTNLWGIHVTGIASGGTTGLANDLNGGLVDDDLVIGMSYDLMAAQPDTQFLALDDYAQDEKFGVTSFFETESPFSDFSPRFGESVHYAIPLAYNTGILLYNQGWAEELGFSEPPNDRDALLSQAQAAKDANLVDSNYFNNGTGGLLLSQTALSAQSWYRSYGGDFQTQNGAFTPQPEPLMASFHFLRSAFDANQSWVGVEPTSYRYISDRYAIITEGSLESLPFQAAYQQSGNFKDAWTTLSYPGTNGENNLLLEPLSFAVQRSDPNSELAAWVFAQWLMQPAQQVRLVEIHGLWPSIGDPRTIAPDYASAHPYWIAALENDPSMTVVPENSDWATVRLVFQDAYQRIFNLDPEYFLSILDVFGQTTQTNQEQRP